MSIMFRSSRWAHGLPEASARQCRRKRCDFRNNVQTLHDLSGTAQRAQDMSGGVRSWDFDCGHLHLVALLDAAMKNPVVQTATLVRNVPGRERRLVPPARVW